MMKIIKNFLKKFETIKILLGLKNTYLIFKKINKQLINKNKITHITSELKIQNKTYKLTTNPFDLRSYVIDKGRQNHKINFLYDFLRKGYFFDIGANYGEFSVVISPKQYRTFCFEPNTLVFNCLKKTFKNSKDVSIYNVGVSDEENQEKFYSKILNSGNSSFKDSNQIKKIYSINDFANNFLIPYNCNLIKLSKFLEQNITDKKIIINIKIDVEGFEYKILNDILNYRHINTCKLFIIFENNQNSKPFRDQLNNILSNYKKFGFKFIVIPSLLENFNNFKKNYRDLNSIDLNENSEICIVNYELF